MTKRIVTGVIAGAIFLGLLVLGGVFFKIFIGLLVILAMQELFKMHKLKLGSFEGVLATLAALSLAIPDFRHIFSQHSDGNTLLFMLFVFIMLVGTVIFSRDYSFEDVGFPFLTAFFVGMGFQSLLLARESNIYTVFLALFIVWSTDIGAYGFGKAFGKNKLLPAVSPNKTVEGSIGGIGSALVVALIMWAFFHHHLPQIGTFRLIIFAIIFSVVGQLGDLVESAMKRHYGVKDSGKILPGHGGILDRFDNLIFVFPIMHLLGLF